ncbi:MAG: hypothetical protein ACRDRX_11190 [Pseudonocardiaceae bacterium]
MIAADSRASATAPAHPPGVVDLILSDTMIPTAVLELAGSNVTWVSVLSMIGQWLGAIGTVTVAIVARC